MRFEVGQLVHVDLLTTLSGRLALFLILLEVGPFFILPGQIPRKCPNLLIFAAHDDIAVLVVRHGPNRLWQLNRLFACAVSPELDSAIVTACDDLASFEAIYAEDEAIVAFEIHHMSAIE